MWSPTTNEISDNKKSVEVEERRSSKVGSDNKNQQQESLNIFDSKHQQYSEKIDDLTKKEQEFASETVDSGFISGPQSSSNIFEDKDLEDIREIPQISQTSQKFNITAATPLVSDFQQKLNNKQQEIEEKIILDSGCIEDDVDITEVEYEHKAAVVAAIDKNQKQQVQREQSKATVAASTIANNNKNSEQMILKNDVDAGMSERFCNLSLQAGTGSGIIGITQQQQQIAGFGINNLNYTSRTQTSAVNTTTGITTQITASNAWEEYYQQNDEGDTPLHLACVSGDVDVVIALLRMAPHPCLFNIQNDIAQTPLHLAALTAQPKLIRMLLLAGAVPTIRDRLGNTALHISCINGEEQCVKALTNKFGQSEINEAHRLFGHRTPDKMSVLGYKNLPADLEIRNYDGERCVHLAAHAGHIEILRILKDQGADINAREGKSGCTPLHMAIECCNEDLANFLLDECEKLNLETATYAGLTAYQFACILNKSQMQNILEKRGAELLTPPDSDYSDSEFENEIDDTQNYDRFGDTNYFNQCNGAMRLTVI